LGHIFAVYENSYFNTASNVYGSFQAPWNTKLVASSFSFLVLGFSSKLVLKTVETRFVSVTSFTSGSNVL
jgi:hypothetical protein